MRSRQSPCRGWAGRRPISYVPVTAPRVARWGETPTTRTRRGPRAGASGLPRRCGSLAPLFSGFGDAAPCRTGATGVSIFVLHRGVSRWSCFKSILGALSPFAGLRDRARAGCPPGRSDPVVPRSRAASSEGNSASAFPRRAGSPRLARNADSFLQACAPCWGEERSRARPQRGPTRGPRPPQLRDKTCSSPVNPERRGRLRCLREG